MAKLFALEEAGLSKEVVEMETSPEAGEVADAQIDVETDVNEIKEVEAGIEEGIGAADQLEKVEEIVENAAKNDGLDPVAADAVKVAVEAICARVGANPKAVYSLYAAENFKSASSRKANTKYALEGIGEFLKNLWEKIKAALLSLWEKVKNFWNKHISSLGRSIKALESMKVKVAALKGNPTLEPVEVPSNLKSIFPVKAVLGIEEINGFANTLDEAEKSVTNFFLLDKMSSAATLKAIIEIIDATKDGVKITFGSEVKPMPGGTYHVWEFKTESEKDNNSEVTTVYVQEESGKSESGNNNVQLDIANKEKLKTLIDATLKRARDIAKYRDRADKRIKAAQQSLRAINKEIDSIQDSDTKEQVRNALRSYNLIMSKGPAIEAKLLSYNLIFIRGVLGYTATCIKHTRAS